jgi:F-type H+-transporting ATPase subunit epsilon
MKLKVLTPERVVLEDDVDAVYAENSAGQFGVLPKHIPIVTPLEISVLYYQKAGKKQPVAVMGGLFRTDGQQVTVLSDTAEQGAEIDVVRAQHAKERAQALLHKKTAEDIDIKKAELSLERALTRLKAAESVQ